jgi:uncharacterized lipoprotein YajG
MKRLIVPILAAAGLAACASEPQVVNSAPPGVSYRFSGDNVAEANLRADRYCAQYGRRAALQAVNRGASDNIAVYECN